MKKSILFFGFCFILLFVLSCQLNLKQPVPEGFVFDEQAFNDAQQRWKNLGLENYQFSFTFRVGYFSDPYQRAIGPEYYAQVFVKIRVTNGVSQIEEIETSYRPDEEIQQIENQVNVVLSNIKTIEDIFDLIQGRIQDTKEAYVVQDCSFYEMDVEYYKNGCPKKITDYYFICGKESKANRMRICIDFSES